MSLARVPTGRLGNAIVVMGFMAAAISSALAGATLAAIAVRFEKGAPLVLLAIPLAPILLGAVFWNPRLGVIAVLATFPVGSVTVVPAPVALQTAELAVFVVVVVVVMRRLASGEGLLPWSAALWWMLALIGWTVFALLSAVDTELALKQIALLCGGLVFMTVVLAACRRMADVRVILGSLSAVAAGIAIMGFASADEMRAEFGGSIATGRLVGGAFDHPNQLGVVCSMAALITVGLILGARSQWSRAAGVAALLLLVGGLMLSLSRGAWIGTMLGLLYLALVLPTARRAILLGGAPLVVIALFIGSFAPRNAQLEVVQQRFRALTVKSPYDDRPAIWAEALREIRADPLTGQGPGGFPVASARAGSEATMVAAYHAHNLLLTWAAESGIPAAVLVVGFFIALGAVTHRAGRAALRQRDGKERAVIAAMFAAVIAILGQGLVDFTWRNAVVFFAVSGLAGCILAAGRVLSFDDSSAAFPLTAPVSASRGEA